MDYESILCELFPQVDARLIKATLLDGDDLESAVDFLVKEVIRSDAMRPDHMLGIIKDSPEMSADHSVDTNSSPKPLSIGSDEPDRIYPGTEKKLTEECQIEGSSDINCDKQEESIVWLVGHQNHQPFNSGNRPSFAASPSSGLTERLSLLSINRPEEESISFQSKSSLESQNSGHDSDKNHDCDTESSTVLSEPNINLIPAGLPVQAHDFVPISEERLGFDFSDSQQHLRSAQQLQTIEIIADGLVMDSKEPQLLDDGQTKDCKLANLGQQVSDNANEINSSEALKNQEEASAAGQWERIPWEFSSGKVNESQGYLENDPFTESTTEQFEPVNYFDTPKPSYDESLSADLSCDYRVVLDTSKGPSRHSVDIGELDELVKEAKSEKEHLLKTFEEVQLIRLETEKEEAAAHQAKTEAASGGFDILVKVDEMRQKIAEVKVHNEMRAGEIYGEKAVLSTEARELGSRLTQAKAEQVKALNLVNEIRSTLSSRLDVAKRERQGALEEKMRKERDAQELLAIEEASMDGVAHNSKDLDAEAEACTKLRDFLIDRGSIVDSLQGEMSVLCEDVESFKKQVDECILLSGNRSLSVSRMSHLTEELLSTSLRSRQSHTSQDFKRAAFGEVETNMEGSTAVFAGSESSSNKSLKYFVSRTSSCFNSDDSASVHSALGFEDSGIATGGGTDLSIEEKDPQAADSALCTDYFSPNNSVMEMASEGAVPDLETSKQNSSCQGNLGGENGDGQFGIQPDDGKIQALVTTTSAISDDLEGWHDDDDWHMLHAHEAKK